MLVKYVHVTENILFSNNIFTKLVKSHNNWIIEGKDDLISDTLFVMDFENTLIGITRHTDDKDKYQSIDKTDSGIIRLNWFMKEPFIINDKKDTSFIECGNQSTIGIFYFVKINQNDRDILRKKQNIVIDALWNTLLPIWGDKLSRIKKDGTHSRNDILINGKKVAGYTCVIGDTRADITVGIQNIFTSKEDEVINTLMKGDRQWSDNTKASDVITGANLRIENLIANLQKEVDKIQY